MTTVLHQDYVLGFAFNLDRSKLVLIEKTRPAWQAGKMNAIGGKIDDGEDRLDAMCREFKEETGVHTTPDEWHHFTNIIGKDGTVFCYRLFDDKILHARTMEDQPIAIVDADLNFLQQHALSSLPWLTGIALDEAQPVFFVEARYDMAFLSGKVSKK